MTITPAAAWNQRAESPLIVITGAINAGKTTFCRALIDHVRDQGGRVAGLLSPAEFADDAKIAIDLIDLSTDQRRRLATRRAQPDPTSPTPNWAFGADALAWGDTVIQAVRAPDLLVIDELGPLELRHNQGRRSALPLIARGDYDLACVVVRPTLIDVFTERYPAARVIALD